ncbi:MAG: hypothetical protein Q9209_006663 [Squamulea sp. 1 TL-2023]
MDGILGLGLPARRSTGYPTFMGTIQETNTLSSNLLGVSLQRSGHEATDRELTFGGPNTTKYPGELSYTTVVGGASLWEIPISEIKVDGAPCAFTGKTAIVDTGALPKKQLTRRQPPVFNTSLASPTPSLSNSNRISLTPLATTSMEAAAITVSSATTSTSLLANGQQNVQTPIAVANGKQPDVILGFAILPYWIAWNVSKVTLPYGPVHGPTGGACSPVALRTTESRPPLRQSFPVPAMLAK